MIPPRKERRLALRAGQEIDSPVRDPQYTRSAYDKIEEYSLNHGGDHLGIEGWNPLEVPDFAFYSTWQAT